MGYCYSISNSPVYQHKDDKCEQGGDEILCTRKARREKLQQAAERVKYEKLIWKEGHASLKLILFELFIIEFLLSLEI